MTPEKPGMTNRNMRIGVFGGSFDPPHNGHLIVASDAARGLRLDRVILVPSAMPPHKLGRQLSAPEDRLAMCRLAVVENELFEVSDVEIRREGVSYTVDTLNELKREVPAGELFLLIGMDNYVEFHLWRDPGGILELATVAVMERPGYPGADPEKVESDRVIRVSVRQVDISSTRIRELVSGGESIRSLVPAGVRRYIDQHALYR
jgi:nicotinate-nucleotide adenylyltransferase